MDIGYFLKLMTEKNASDMFLTTGAPVYIKVEGKLYPLGNTGLPGGMVKKIAYSLMDEGQVPAVRARPGTEHGHRGEGRRPLPRQRVQAARRSGHGDPRHQERDPRIEQLKLPQVLKDIIMEPRGLVLVVGSTGSGKSTTLAAMIDHRNSNTPATSSPSRIRSSTCTGTRNPSSTSAKWAWTPTASTTRSRTRCARRRT
jgi:twitching motility protein PilU